MICIRKSASEESSASICHLQAPCNHHRQPIFELWRAPRRHSGRQDHSTGGVNKDFIRKQVVLCLGVNLPQLNVSIMRTTIVLLLDASVNRVKLPHCDGDIPTIPTAMSNRLQAVFRTSPSLPKHVSTRS